MYWKHRKVDFINSAQPVGMNHAFKILKIQEFQNFGGNEKIRIEMSDRLASG